MSGVIIINIATANPYFGSAPAGVERGETTTGIDFSPANLRILVLPEDSSARIKMREASFHSIPL